MNLAKVLGSRDSTLRRDECGDWRIEGAHGFASGRLVTLRIGARRLVTVGALEAPFERGLEMTSKKRSAPRREYCDPTGGVD